MTHVRHVLVLPDRDAAEEVAELAVERFGAPEEPQVLREALAGEDDDEDAQWLVVLEDGGDGAYEAEKLALLAEEYEGWRESGHGH